MSKLEDSIEAFTQAKAAAAAALSALHEAKTHLDPAVEENGKRRQAFEAQLDALLELLPKVKARSLEVRLDDLFAAMTQTASTGMDALHQHDATKEAFAALNNAERTRDRTKRQLLEAQQKLEPLIAATVAGIVGKDSP